MGCRQSFDEAAISKFFILGVSTELPNIRCVETCAESPSSGARYGRNPRCRCYTGTRPMTMSFHRTDNLTTGRTSILPLNSLGSTCTTVFIITVPTSQLTYLIAESRHIRE